MHLQKTLSLALGAAILALAGCTTPPSPPPPASAVKAAPVLKEIIPEGVYVSPPKTGNTSAAFDKTGKDDGTFPNNLIGARLIFTADLKMPKLEAVITSPTTFQLLIRFANPGTKNVNVSLVCTYSEDDTKSRRIKNLSFPVNSYRDIAIDFQGRPERTLYIRANTVP